MRYSKIFTSLIVAFAFSNSNYAQKNEPKLMVGIVVDQMSYEYLYRFFNHFGDSGFKRMMKNGTNARNMHYNYVPTYTGPGHASIYTGTTPANHGIIANDWYDYTTGKELNCVYDKDAKTVGSLSNKGEYAPTRLMVNTITDQLKMTHSESKVISLSIKNRGAILPGGHLSDGTYWFDETVGKFITSTFYQDQLPGWLNNFNSNGKADLYAESTWDTYRPIETYKESMEDNNPYEHLLGNKISPTFPYNLKEISTKETRYSTLISTPFGNTLLNDLAIEAIKNEGLGRGAVTDFLAISFSSPDLIGHMFGPQSKEIQDTYIRLDLEIERLLKTLDKQVGKDNYVVFLTADHAVVPVPQLLIDKKLPGGYVYLKEPIQEMNAVFKEKYGKELILHSTNLNLYLDRSFMTLNKIDRTEIDNFIITFLMNIDGIKRVYSCNQLLNSAGDQWFDMVRAGYHPNESGDILFVLESGYLAKSTKKSDSEKGTSHGSPFAYDTHVPFLIFGKNIPKQEISRKTKIIDIAPSIAEIMNISFSHGTTGNVIVELFK